MSIVISDEILGLTNYTELEFRLEISIVLYQKKKLSLGQAANFSKISKFQFQKELSLRKIPLNYDIEEFKKDLQTIEALSH